jgi:hypothetical protein
MMHYYAVRYASVPEHIRIYKTATPEGAFRKAFGCPPPEPIPLTDRVHRGEYKDLGTRVKAIQSANFAKKLKAKDGWVTFNKGNEPK